MKEIEANKKAWSLLAKDHYATFKSRLATENVLLNRIISEELGDVAAKSLIHLQCNTGADTISLARMGARVTGVDLVPENIFYAQRLAQDFGHTDVVFLASDIMELQECHHEKYDIVFTSEGAIGWLPDLRQWGRTIRHLLKDDGFFYTMDSHPFFLALDEEKIRENILDLKYPYFGQEPDVSDTIGGYASERKNATCFFWMYTVGDLVNALTEAGLVVEFLHEHDVLFYDNGGMEQVEKGLYRYPFLQGRLPLSFSLKATVRRS